jgi:disulfide bond formation protein DsbB
MDMLKTPGYLLKGDFNPARRKVALAVLLIGYAMRNVIPAPRPLWLILAATCFGLAAGSLVLTAWLDLHPCHLCIAQRLLYLLLAPLFLAAGLLSPRPVARWTGLLALPFAAGGLAIAVYQSWLQMQPAGSVTCMSGDPGLIERLVEWLAHISPELFMATGFCEQVELKIVGLSLANWSALGFTACLVLAYLAWRRPGERRIFTA